MIAPRPRATMHWHWAEALQRRHPGIQVEADRIYIADGPVWTSAGMTAELDLALALVEKDLAGVARLSPRQFSRVFTAETGQSPAKAIEGLRLEAARTGPPLLRTRGGYSLSPSALATPAP
ncbi:hypothetical protein D9M68_730080 [compost metagenome]